MNENDRMNMLPDPSKEVVTRGRAEREFVTRREFEDFRKSAWLCIILTAIGLLFASMFFTFARAGTTKVFQAIEKPSGVCNRVCKICGKCVPILVPSGSYEWHEYHDYPEDAGPNHWVFLDSQDSTNAMYRCARPMFKDSTFLVDTVGCGKIVWGRWITPFDTIPVVRARGLDSCFSLGYDSTDVFIYKPRWLYRIKHSKDTTFREADELLKGGQ